jgi:cytochrome c553
MIKYLLIALAFILPPTSDGHAAEVIDGAVIKLATQVCALCHGRGGRSIAPTFPILDGQTALYIAKQLNAFKNQTRKDPDALAFMWGMAAQLDQETIQGLGAFYAAQKTAPSRQEDPKSAGRGGEIYYQGIADAGVAPCANCHGRDAQGIGEFPRLAGQHAAYLVKQLQAFRTGLRESPIMRPIAEKLGDEETLAVASFLRAK